MANKWDNFHENMGDENAALHMSGAFDSEVGHDHDPTLPGRGAQISYNSLKDKPTSIANATNVTTNINGMAVTDIFESDKKTVKKATSATGNERFQVSGCLGGLFGEPFASIPPQLGCMAQQLYINVPPGKGLYLKRVRYRLTHVDLRFRIYALGANEWISSSHQGDEELNFLLNSETTPTILDIYNASQSYRDAYPSSGWWLDLAIEDV